MAKPFFHRDTGLVFTPYRNGLFINREAGMAYDSNRKIFVDVRTGQRFRSPVRAPRAERALSGQRAPGLPQRRTGAPPQQRAMGFLSSMLSTNFNPPRQGAVQRKRGPAIFTRRRKMMMAGNLLFRR